MIEGSNYFFYNIWIGTSIKIECVWTVLGLEWMAKKQNLIYSTFAILIYVMNIIFIVPDSVWIMLHIHVPINDNCPCLRVILKPTYIISCVIRTTLILLSEQEIKWGINTKGGQLYFFMYCHRLLINRVSQTNSRRDFTSYPGAEYVTQWNHKPQDSNYLSK